MVFLKILSQLAFNHLKFLMMFQLRFYVEEHYLSGLLMVYLHRISIANWFPSSHVSNVSVALGTFLYQICNNETVDTGLFIYDQLLRHIGTFGVKIPIPLFRFFSS